jgi:hypothetical protein
MNKKTLLAIILPLLLVALAVSVFVVKGTRLEWEKVADGSGAGEEFVTRYADLSFAYVGHEPRLIVITEPDAVPTLQGKVSSEHLERIADTDFSSFWVTIVYQGREVMKDYQPIEVSEVRRKGDTVTVYAQFHETIGSLDTSPYCILKIEKPVRMDEEKIAFTLNADGQMVSQICSMNGEHLPWKKILFDRGVDQAYRGHSPQLIGMISLDALSSIQDQLPTQYLDFLSNVDFTTHFAIVIYQGLKGSTHYSVEVIDVKRQDSTIFVCAQFHEPLPKVARGPMETSPFYVMKVEKPADWSDSFTFVLLDGDTEVIRQESLIPPLFESPLPSPTSAPTATPSPAPTPIATSPASPLGFPCHSYLDLLISAGGAEEQAVVTSYRCHNTWIDSTGRFPPQSPSLVVPKGVPLHFRLAAEQRPAMVDVRIYSGTGVSASFFIWPEELPIKVEPVERFQPAPSSAFEYLPQVAPGEYSLVVRAVWEEPIEVFYATSFRVE